MTSLRECVRKNPRKFCCSGPVFVEIPGRSMERSERSLGALRACYTRPQYPKNEDSDRCQSFRCTRCKATVGWCVGADHGKGHPANDWCADCWVEVYGSKKEENDGHPVQEQ